MKVLDLVYLGAGALLGAFIRYKITGNDISLNGLPLSVLIVNLIGSLILGFSMEGIQRFGLDQRYVIFIGIGFCGSLTTMSSFAYETSNLVDAGKLVIAGLDVLLNVGVSILAIFAGRAVMLLIWGVV